MGARASLLLCMTSCAALSAAREARAQSAANDIALSRLSLYDPSSPDAPGAGALFQGGCGSASASWARCHPDHQLFANLAAQLGTVIAPTLATPAGTLGTRGFSVMQELAITSIDASSDAWARGTHGGALAGTGTSARRTDTPSVLAVPRLHVRKGLPMGFELGARIGGVGGSGIWALGADVRFAIVEGFTQGAWKAVPDLAVRVGIDGVVGADALSLAVVSVDVSASKSVLFGGRFALTPYAGFQVLTILARSGVVDGTPGRNAHAECPRAGCLGGTGIPMGATSDVQNDMVFAPVTVVRTRVATGLRFRWGPWITGVEGAFDVAPPTLPESEGLGRPDAQGARGAPTLDPFLQWSLAVSTGVQL